MLHIFATIIGIVYSPESTKWLRLPNFSAPVSRKLSQLQQSV